MQVDGCGIELINEKTYYKRYRICVTHCNMKSMVIQGRRQRFCQQCGRFHDCTEFEGTRKSCRRKLERHNQRRRTVPTKGCAWQSDSEEDDIDVAEDAEYQALANMKRGGRARSARLKSLDVPSPNTAAPSIAAESPSSTILDKQYSSMDLDNPIAGFVPLIDAPAGGSSAALKDMVPQPLSSSDGGAVTRDGLPLVDATTSARNSPDARLCNVHGSTTSILPLPMAPGGNLQEHPSAFGPMKDTPFYNGLLDDDFLGGLLMFPEDISDSLVVSAHDQLSRGADASVAVNHQQAADVQSWLQADFATFNELNTATSPRQAAAEANQAAAFATSYHQQQQQQNQHDFGLQELAQLQPQHPTTALEAASSMVSMDAPALVGYSVNDSMLRLSIKLFNCTPDLLAPKVKSELTSLLRVAEQSLVEGYIRPGCMHVTLSVRVPAPTVPLSKDVPAEGTTRGNLVAAVEKLLLEGTALTSEAKESMLVQLHDELIVVKQQRVIAAIDMGKSLGLLPCITAVRPLAVVAAGNGTGRTAVTLVGRRLNGPSSLIMCRQGGRNLTIELPDEEDEDESANVAAGQVINIGVLGIAAGCAELEVQVGSFLGPSKPLVALPDAAAVEEVRQLETSNNGSANNLPIDSFLRDLGLVAQYLERQQAEIDGRAVPNYTPELLNTIQKIACKLVAAAVSRKWIALTTYLLPATTAAGQTKEEAVAVMDAACPRGSTLLHVAVGTGNVEIVQKLAQWAARSSSSSSASSTAAETLETTCAGPFLVNVKGVGGVTPLHVAAMLPPKVCFAMRRELTNISSAVPKLWGLAQSDDGTTPEGLAEMVAGGGRSSGSGTHRTKVYMKPTPFSMSADYTSKTSLTGTEPHQLDAVMEKSNSAHSLSVDDASLSGILSWKTRSEVKAQFVDHHIGNMMDEVRCLQTGNNNGISAWQMGAAIGSTMVLVLGTAAMAFHLA
jgi:hypothetical protein